MIACYMAMSGLINSDIYLTMLPDKFYEKLQSLVTLNACILKGYKRSPLMHAASPPPKAE